MSTKKFVFKGKGDTYFNIINNCILTIILIVTIYPLYFILIASISDPQAVNEGRVILLPQMITLEGYQLIFNNAKIWIGYRNTIMYTVVGTLFNIILTMTLAYPLSRKRYRLRNAIMVYLMITMYFSGGLIPTYLLVRSLGLYNTWTVMWILGGVGVFNVVITRTFLQSTIPDELYEAAIMDGCSDIAFFIRFVIPLSKAIMAVLAIYYGLGHWNQYTRGLIYLNDENKEPLQLVLRRILVLNITEDDFTDENFMEILRKQRLQGLVKYGLIIISSAPLLAAYPFLQKYFQKGVMVGSIKG